MGGAGVNQLVNGRYLLLFKAPGPDGRWSTGRPRRLGSDRACQAAFKSVVVSQTVRQCKPLPVGARPGPLAKLGPRLAPDSPKEPTAAAAAPMAASKTAGVTGPG